MRRFALALLACGACAPGEQPVSLEPGRFMSLELQRANRWRQSVEVRVDPGWLAVHAAVEGADLPMSLRWIPPDEEQPALETFLEGGVAMLPLNRFSFPAIEPGIWTLEVRYDGVLPPQTGSRMLASIPATISVRPFKMPEPRELTPGQALHIEALEPDCGTHGFQFDVPPATARVRIDIYGTTTDWSLYARRGAPVGTLDEALATRATPLSAETLILGDDEPLMSGRWYLDCVDADLSGDGSGFSILLSLEERAPALLQQPLPLIEADEDPFAAASACVVEVATEDSVGSGTLVGPRGFVLTNAHVVGTASQAVISVTLDPANPPVESFRATVEWRDHDLDLALLQLRSGYYGQELPAGYRLPHARLGDPEQVFEGDPLWMVGYPRTGGSQNRVPRHLTHGVLSGLEAYDGLVRLKSDAAIYLGNSGGAVFDSEARLVAVPTSMVEFSSGQTAFLHPWTWVPPEWRERAGLEP